jgi:hypothetical protein
MQRKSFLKSACTLGICSCTGIAALSSAELFGKNKSLEEKDPNPQLNFIQKRFAKLVQNLDSNVNEEQKEKILEGLGSACAEESKDYFVKYKGNINGFLEEIKKSWAEKTEYNIESGYLRITGKKQKACACPFVDNSIMSKDFCNCTLGWNKVVYSTILGKPVDAKIEDSVLRGGEQCTILIKFA